MRLIDADKFKELFYTDTAIGKIMRLMIEAIEIVKSGGVE